MARRYGLLGTLALAAVGVAWLVLAGPVSACGGFFCIDSPVDQNAERIIFTQNGDGTVSAYVQIAYTGSAPEFSWILPLPEAIPAEAVEVPEGTMAAFGELEAATDPVFLLPPLPDCPVPTSVATAAAVSMPVEVFASGEVGPYGFDVVGSEDPDALVTWLRKNSYRVTEAMEPLIDVYVVEGFVFLAMKLRPDAGVQDVEPVKVTYPSETPMIPLRLTAVAATPNMAVMVWVYAEAQAAPANYAAAAIADDELIFFRRGATNNYRSLMGQKADEHGGQAFITEYAGPTQGLAVGHPLLQELHLQYPYVTRLNTVISPEEMTVDPVFRYDGSLGDVSNVRDLTGRRLECDGPWMTVRAAPVAFAHRGRVEVSRATGAVTAAPTSTNAIEATTAAAAGDDAGGGPVGVAAAVQADSNESTIITFVGVGALAVMALAALGFSLRRRGREGSG